MIKVTVAVESDSVLFLDEYIDIFDSPVSKLWNDTHESATDWDNEEHSSEGGNPPWPVSVN